MNGCQYRYITWILCQSKCMTPKKTQQFCMKWLEHIPVTPNDMILAIRVLQKVSIFECDFCRLCIFMICFNITYFADYYEFVNIYFILIWFILISISLSCLTQPESTRRTQIFLVYREPKVTKKDFFALLGQK